MVGDYLTLRSNSKIDLATLHRALAISFLIYTELIIDLPFIDELVNHLLKHLFL